MIRLTGHGEITSATVARYLAKYATKSTESAGLPPGRVTAENAAIYADLRTHQGRLIAACLRLGNHPHEDFRAYAADGAGEVTANARGQPPSGP